MITKEQLIRLINIITLIYGLLIICSILGIVRWFMYIDSNTYWKIAMYILVITSACVVLQHIIACIIYKKWEYEYLILNNGRLTLDDHIKYRLTSGSTGYNTEGVCIDLCFTLLISTTISALYFMIPLVLETLAFLYTMNKIKELFQIKEKPNVLDTN